MLVKESKRVDSNGFESSDCVDLKAAMRVVGMPRVVSELKDGRLVQRVEFVETPLEELNKGLKVDDFAIEVLLQSGYEPHKLSMDNVEFSEVDRLSENVSENVSVN